MDVIRTYVRGAFAGVAQTPEALEQQQELITNMEEKVRDLVAEGKGEQEALGITIAEAGDLTVLASEFPTAESVAAAPPTAKIRLSQRALLARIGGVFTALVAMLLVGAFAGAVSQIDGAAFLLVVLSVALGVWRVLVALRDFRSEPDAEGEVPLGEWRPSRDALLQWVGICALAGVVNAAMGVEFFAWVVWAAAMVLPAEALLRTLLVHYGVVTIPPAEPKPATAETTVCPTSPTAAVA
jgi:hypothetical protein